MRMLSRSLLVAVLASAAIVAAAPASAQTKLKWAHVYETSEPFHKWSVWAAQEIEKRTNGRYHIDVFPASTLGKESDINQGMTLGTVDMIISGLSFAARSFPRLAVSYYPFTFRDADHVIKYSKSDVFKELTEGYKKASGGNTVTALTYYGARHATSNKLFTTCEQMKGLKMRVPDAPAYTALPRACGANPTPIAFAEVYLALQNGTVDAQENPLPTIDAKKFYEVQKFIVLTGHITDALLTIVGGPTWNKLSDADKKIFEDTLKEAAVRATNEIVDTEKKMAAEFEKRGKTVVRVDRKPFREATVKLHNGPDATWPKDVYDKLQKL
jgi:tripartite ATP-independent transporter DctP family solute receptor